MKETTADFQASDGKTIRVLKWSNDSAAPKAAVLIVHGVTEYGGRYRGFAQVLCDRGYVAYAPDHRGHGRTVESPEELGHYAENDGFQRIIEDLFELTAKIKSENPGKPLVIYGHSMGSMLVRLCVSQKGGDYDACILTGTMGRGPYGFGRGLARILCALSGGTRRIAFLGDIAFGPFSRPFKPNRTQFDWLSRDEAEVDKYVADPLCGFPLTNAFFRDFFGGMARMYRKSMMAAIPLDLPILCCSGSRDPVGGMSGAVEALADEYRALGIKEVDCRIFPDARHELLNETNRREVMEYLADWADAAL